MINIKDDYQNYSGGAKGSDLYWEVCGKKYGFNFHTHIVNNDYDKKHSSLKEVIESIYVQVCNKIKRPVLDANTYGGKLVRRDILQGQVGSSIYAIVEKIVKPNEFDSRGFKNKSNMSVPSGGSAYACITGVLLNKPVFVFSQETCKWYRYSEKHSDFIEIDSDKVEILHESYTGIGTRNIDSNGKRAIEELYIKLNNKLTTKN